MVGYQDLQELNEPTIDFFILADRAEAVSGKLYLMGGAWDRTWVQDFSQPVLISFAVGINVPWNATNQPHQVQVIVHELDKPDPPICTVGAEFITSRPATLAPGEAQRAILAVPTIPV